MGKGKVFPNINVTVYEGEVYISLCSECAKPIARKFCVACGSDYRSWAEHHSPRPVGQLSHSHDHHLMRTMSVVLYHYWVLCH